MSDDPYKILGVHRNATPKEIKAAYKRAANAHHPDKSNGNGDVFVEIKLAYEVLINTERRNLYDKTGVYERNQKGNHTREVMVKLFLLVMGQGLDVVHENILNRMRTTAREKIKEIDAGDKELLREGDRLDEAMARLSNPNGENILEAVIKSKLDVINEAIDSNAAERQTVLDVLEMIDDYEYHPDEVEKITNDDVTNSAFNTYRGSCIHWGPA